MEQQKIETYINEYNLVTNKITSLSMKFSNGSYVISASLFIGVASINMAAESLFKSAIFIVLPIIILFSLYNHIRYMVLQFKLSGYAKHLENKINEILKENILLWENTIARGSKQNIFEGFFFVVIYISILFLVFYGAYYNLAIVFYNNRNISFALCGIISFIYYCMTMFVVFFLAFFINEHDKTYKKAASIDKKAFTSDDNDNIVTYKVSIKEEENTPPKKMIISINNSAKKTNKSSISKCLRRRSGKIKMCCMVAFILLIPISLYPWMFFSKCSADTVEKTYDYIVVLGNKSSGNGLSDDMKCRLDCLIDHIDNFANPTIIVSGGNGEAAKMKKYLMIQGMSGDSIILEEYSKNTRENLENTCKKIESLKNTESIAAENVLVITSDYHVFRTKLLSYKLNLDWDILPAKSKGFMTFIKALKECYAVYFTVIAK